MTRFHVVAVPLLAAILGSSSVVRAEPPAASSAITSSSEPTPDAQNPAASEDDGGASVPGIVLMIVGGAAVGVGATLAIVDATRSDPETYERGLDPGVGGARGRAGQLPVVESSTMGPVGAVLLGAGALVHVIGVALVFGGSGSDEETSPRPERASVEPVIGAGYGGLQGTF